MDSPSTFFSKIFCIPDWSRIPENSNLHIVKTRQIEPRNCELEPEKHEHKTLAKFVSQMEKIKREDEETVNEFTD